ncbi:hypothetical protein V2J09_011758 [Rumex salicifolius]
MRFITKSLRKGGNPHMRTNGNMIITGKRVSNTDVNEGVGNHFQHRGFKNREQWPAGFPFRMLSASAASGETQMGCLKVYESSTLPSFFRMTMPKPVPMDSRTEASTFSLNLFTSWGFHRIGVFSLCPIRSEMWKDPDTTG